MLRLLLLSVLTITITLSPHLSYGMNKDSWEADLKDWHLPAKFKQLVDKSLTPLPGTEELILEKGRILFAQHGIKEFVASDESPAVSSPLNQALESGRKSEDLQKLRDEADRLNDEEKFEYPAQAKKQDKTLTFPLLQAILNSRTTPLFKQDKTPLDTLMNNTLCPHSRETQMAYSKQGFHPLLQGLLQPFDKKGTTLLEGIAQLCVAYGDSKDFYKYNDEKPIIMKAYNPTTFNFEPLTLFAVTHKLVYQITKMYINENRVKPGEKNSTSNSSEAKERYIEPLYSAFEIEFNKIFKKVQEAATTRELVISLGLSEENAYKFKQLVTLNPDFDQILQDLKRVKKSDEEKSSS